MYYTRVRSPRPLMAGVRLTERIKRKMMNPTCYVGTIIIAMSLGCACPRPQLENIEILNANAQEYSHSDDILLRELSINKDMTLSAILVNIPEGQWVPTVSMTGEYLVPGTDYNQLYSMKIEYNILDCLGKQSAHYFSALVACGGALDFEQPPKQLHAFCEGNSNCAIKGGKGRWYSVTINTSSIERYLKSAKVRILLLRYPSKY
jgi:hypothetical protein